MFFSNLARPDRSVWTAISLTIFFFLPSLVVAEKPELERANISWREVLEVAENHPAVRAKQHTVAAAKSKLMASRAVPNPELEASAGYGIAIDGSESRIEWGVELSIPLDWLGKRGARIDVANAQVSAAQLDEDALRRDVLLQLRLLFWDLLYNQEQVTELRALADHSDKLLRIVQTRVDKGEVRPVQAAQVKVESQKISADLIMAESELKISQNKLAMWLNIGDRQVLFAVANPAQFPKTSTTPLNQDEVVSSHPTLRTEAAELEAFSATVELEKKERIPGFAISPFFDSELDRRAAGVGLSVELPLWNHNAGNIEKAKNALLAKKSSIETRRLELHSELLEYEVACEAGVNMATFYRDAVLPQAQTVAGTIERTYQLGEATLFEVLNATRTLLETRLQFVALSLQAQRACSRFAAVTGGNI